MKRMEAVEIEYPCTINNTSEIYSGSRIGINTNIGANCTIGPNVSIGAGCYINNHVNICEGVIIQNRVFIGPSTVFTNVRYPRAFIDPVYERTTVMVGASLGANVTVRCGVTIGQYAMVGAGSVVINNVPNHALVVGNPAKHIGYVCWCGKRLLVTGGVFSTKGECLKLECLSCKEKEFKYQYITDYEMKHVRRDDGNPETGI